MVVCGPSETTVQCYVENILISIAKEDARTHLKIVYAPHTFASEGKLKLKPKEIEFHTGG